MKTMLRGAIRRLGFDVVRYPSPHEGEVADPMPPDMTDEERRIFAAVKPYTMTSVDRVIALLRAVRYVVENRIPGAIAECGVWRGGSMMAVALMLKALGDASRELYLYDTFEGMVAPTERDVMHEGVSAATLLDSSDPHSGFWCEASLEDVQANMASTGYDAQRVHFVKGPVESTIPGTLPGPLAILRLDTDWYESTKHELIHLYPLLASRGVLILDDYGFWNGAREATDEYFAAQANRPLLQRVDYCSRLVIKT